MCDSNAQCTNTNGSYECTCYDGYSQNGLSCNGLYIVNPPMYSFFNLP